MNEFAPQYTTREKIIRVILVFAVAIPAGALIEFWLNPIISEYAKVAHCKSYGSITGLDVLFYGLFVGIPLSLALFVFTLVGPRSIKIIKIGQNPLPGEKVMKPTRYYYGIRAKVAPVLTLAIVLFLVGLSGRGVFWAHDFLTSIEYEYLPLCEGGKPSAMVDAFKVGKRWTALTFISIPV